MHKLVAVTHLDDLSLAGVVGTFETTAGYRIVDRSLRVVNDKGEFVAMLIKASVPVLLQEAAEPYLLKAHGDFSNRGAVIGKGAMLPRIKKDGTLSRRNAVPKEVVKLMGKTDQLGWFDRYDSEVGGVVCRQSAWSLNDPEVVAVTKPLVDWCDFLFSVHAPTEYGLQLVAMNNIRQAHRFTNVWSSLTINVNARTAVHIDKGDIHGGYAALLASGDFEDGYLLLPQYKLAMNVRRGDLLIFNPRQPHGNAPLRGNRLSVVLYGRAGLAKCSSEAA